MGDCEDELNYLKGLEANKRCADCTAVSSWGYDDVCMKFKSFMCHECKSAHQSFSHLCKVRWYARLQPAAPETS